MPRLGSTVYSYEVGQKLDRDLVDDPAELLNLVNTGELESVLPPKDGTKRKLPPALHRKYYKSMSGFCDTPKEVVEAIKRSLCQFDDTYSRCSPQTVVSVAVVLCHFVCDKMCF